MAIVALMTWTLTVAVGVYLLISAARPEAPGGAGEEAGVPAEPVTVAAGNPKAVLRNKFDPPSLARAKAEPIPGGRALAEFIHPMLGIIGFGLFAAYVMSRAWILGAIALGIGAGAVAAGLTWAVVNMRAARRQPADPHAMSFSPRTLALHAAGAGVTILLAVLIVAKV
jgi:hypothetical protein